MIIDQTNGGKETEIILNSIKDHVFKLCFNSYGCHVIEKIITKYDENEINNIYEIIIDNFMLFANNANGLCVIKKILIHANKSSTKEVLKKIIYENCNELIHNAFGNYVIHVVLDVRKLISLN